MFNAIIRAGGLILGAPIAAAGHVLDAVGVLNFTGWQNQMQQFGAEMINGADYIARLREEREQLLESIAAIQAADPLADAGYLVGHLESLCGTKRLLATGGDVEAYLTLCDHAADRLQTHHPTDVLRLDPAERAVVRAALVRL